MMENKIKIGIILCDRYRMCAGGKCLRSFRNREGAFSIYKENEELELVGYTTCGVCPNCNQALGDGNECPYCGYDLGTDFD